MPIENYSTTVDSFATVGKIQRFLAKNGATSLSIQMDDDGNPVSMHFGLYHKGQQMFFVLPTRHDRVLKRLESDRVGARFCTSEHALRVAWRNLEDWVRAQVTLIQTGLVEMPELFLPFAVDKSGETIFQKFEQNHKLLNG